MEGTTPMNWILKLFGFDVKKPLEFLFKVLLLVDDVKLTQEVQNKLCLSMTHKRKQEVAVKLREAADALDNSDCAAFAAVVADVIKGIRL
jgi:hypothetical protein